MSKEPWSRVGPSGLESRVCLSEEVPGAVELHFFVEIDGEETGVRIALQGPVLDAIVRLAAEV